MCKLTHQTDDITYAVRQTLLTTRTNTPPSSHKRRHATHLTYNETLIARNKCYPATQQYHRQDRSWSGRFHAVQDPCCILRIPYFMHDHLSLYVADRLSTPDLRFERGLTAN